MAKPKITPRMREVLEHLSAGRDANHGITGRSSYGGLSSTLVALVRAGLIDNTMGQIITPAGRAALGENNG